LKHNVSYSSVNDFNISKLLALSFEIFSSVVDILVSPFHSSVISSVTSGVSSTVSSIKFHCSSNLGFQKSSGVYHPFLYIASK
jgi:hypothetical protein